MISKIATFKIDANSAMKAEQVITKFLFEIDKNEKGETLLYKSFHYEDDPHSYLHIMTFKNSDAEERHRNAKHTLEFVEALYPICVEPPKFRTVEELQQTKG